MGYPLKTQQAIEKGIRELIDNDPKMTAFYFKLNDIGNTLEELKNLIRIDISERNKK